MKRSISSHLEAEEARLSQLLFNNSEKFIENLANDDLKNTEIQQDLKPVWIDEADEDFPTKLIPNTKVDRLYTDKLKQKYETLMGTPGWAKLKKKKITAVDDIEDDELLRTVGHLHRNKSKDLSKDIVEIKYLPKIVTSSGMLQKGQSLCCVEFHPKSSVLLSAGKTGFVALYSVGGDVNEELHSFSLKRFPVLSVDFTNEGSQAIISSHLSNRYCEYDLVTSTSQYVQLPKQIESPKVFKISPNGKIIAVSENFNEVYLFCAESRELMKCLHHNSYVMSLAFSSDSSKLYSYGAAGEITVWDLSVYRSIKKFYDQGCVTSSYMTISNCGRLLAAGSGEGIVNIYDTSNLDGPEPLPLKTISNLRTKISHLKFNPSTEILALSSSIHNENTVKLAHIPSYNIFSNFPKHTNVIENVEMVSFSPNSGYMAIVNKKSSIFLSRLKHYSNY